MLLVGGHGSRRGRDGRHRVRARGPGPRRWSRPSTSTVRASRRSPSATTTRSTPPTTRCKFRDTVRGVAEVRHGLICSFARQAVRARRRLRRAHPLQPLVAGRSAQPDVRRGRRRPAAVATWAAGSWPACWRTCRRWSRSPAPASTPTSGCGRTRGPARRSRGGRTIASARSASRRRSAVARWSRPTWSSRPATRAATRTSRSAASSWPGSTACAGGLEPPEPARLDPARLSDEQRQRSGIRPLPGSLREALAALQADAVLFPALGDLLGRCLIGVRTAEIEALERMTPDEARLAHLRVF